MSSTEPASPLRIGIAGLGTVGAGVIKLLHANSGLISHRTSREIEVVAVSARDRGRDRGISLDGIAWYENALAVAHDPSVDLVVELIGGADGPALALVEAALTLGKPVVTANKALLAKHGVEIGQLAARHNTSIFFEAAVAGGIPVIKALREGLAGNSFLRISGILNGTCNYILSQMRETGRTLPDVLAEAQQLGYAEADPSFDVDGHDTAHKLAILAAIAFDIPVDSGAVYVEGIRHISSIDIEYAAELGYNIKLVGTAVRTRRGVEQRVHPTMVPAIAPLAMVNGAENAVVIEGDTVGRVVLQGRGAGGGPTASAVVADLIDAARGHAIASFVAAPESDLRAVPIGEHDGPCYVRIMVIDQPGVIADIAGELRDEKVSVEALIQRRHQPGGPVPIVLTTHPSQEARLVRALARIGALRTVVEPPRMIRIEA